MDRPIVYKPADIARWLELGAQTMRKLSAAEASDDLREVVKTALGSVIGQGRGAIAEVMRQRIGALEYRLYDDRFETPRPSGSRSIRYGSIERIVPLKRCEQKIVFREGSFTLKPYAWLTVAGARVPFGWLRDGLEVPWELLVEEIGARARVQVSFR